MTSIKDFNFDSLIGREVGTAVLFKELARGGMAVVFIAFQKTLKRQIAVKILPRSLLTPSAAFLFKQEAESAAGLSHPNVVQIFEFGETEDFLFLAMQLILGKSLLKIIETQRKHFLPSRRIMPLRESIRIVMGILDGLGHAHSRGIIHRDVKPANVLVEDHSKRPILTDFGIAKMIQDSADDLAESYILGSPIYMAPEQIVGERIDARADVYSAGVMLFELVAGVLPLPPAESGDILMRMKAILRDRLFRKKPSELNPPVGPEMDRIVLKAVSHDPDKRYADCREFMDELEEYRRAHLKDETAD